MDPGLEGFLITIPTVRLPIRNLSNKKRALSPETLQLQLTPVVRYLHPPTPPHENPVERSK